MSFFPEEDGGDEGRPLRRHIDHHTSYPGCSECVSEFRAMLAAVALRDRGFITDEPIYRGPISHNSPHLVGCIGADSGHYGDCIPDKVKV